jgi:hypothetical protein
MVKLKPVSIPNGAFIFCRYTIAVLLWVALIFHLKWLVIVIFLILAFSALLKIQRAPLIVLYSYTANLLIKSKDVMLDENAMRFMHTLAASLAFICIVLIYFVNGPVGWGFLLFFASIKTISALGYCPATKLYSCVLSSGSCCAFAKIRK